jgi:hypothetical protein
MQGLRGIRKGYDFMASHPLRGAARRRQRRALAGVFPVVLACNALTGVNDLEFGAAGVSEPNLGANPDMATAPASEGPAVDGGGVAGASGISAPPASPCNASGADGCLDPTVLQPPSNCDLVSANEPRVGLQACGEGLRCTFVPDAAGAGHAACSVPAHGGFEGSACKADAECLASLNCFHGRCAAACNAGASTCAADLRCGGVKLLAGQEVGSCCSIPEGQDCNPVTDCGCDPGWTCALADEQGGTRCRRLSETPVAPYSGCTTTLECPALHSCGSGACKLHCDSVADCDPEGVLCAPATTGGDETPVPGFSYCTRGCDLVSPQEPGVGLRACGVKSTCNIFFNPLLTDCVGEGTGVQGSDCEVDRDCASGFVCYVQTRVAPFIGSCERWCEPASGSCGAGLTCSGGATVYGRELGLCCPTPAGEVCDWATDCGCGPRESCERDGTAPRYCRAVSATPVAPYALCTSDEECSARHTCVGDNCMRRCLQASDCDGGVACIRLSGQDVEGVCARTCDVIAPQAPAAGFQRCESGLTCIIAGEVEATYCFRPGTIEAGGDCTDTFDCSTGLICDQGVCRQYCDLDLTTNGCPNGTTCTLEAPPLPIVGGRRLGLCQPD